MSRYYNATCTKCHKPMVKPVSPPKVRTLLYSPHKCERCRLSEVVSRAYTKGFDDGVREQSSRQFQEQLGGL